MSKAKIFLNHFQNCLHEPGDRNVSIRFDEIVDYIKEHEKYYFALKEIKNQDYRGNRCTCSYIAEKALGDE